MVTPFVGVLSCVSCLMLKLMLYPVWCGFASSVPPLCDVQLVSPVPCLPVHLSTALLPVYGLPVFGHLGSPVQNHYTFPPRCICVMCGGSCNAHKILFVTQHGAFNALAFRLSSNDVHETFVRNSSVAVHFIRQGIRLSPFE